MGVRPSSARLLDLVRRAGRGASGARRELGCTSAGTLGVMLTESNFPHTIAPAHRFPNFDWHTRATGSRAPSDWNAIARAIGSPAPPHPTVFLPSRGHRHPPGRSRRRHRHGGAHHHRQLRVHRPPAPAPDHGRPEADHRGRSRRWDRPSPSPPPFPSPSSATSWTATGGASSRSEGMLASAVFVSLMGFAPSFWPLLLMLVLGGLGAAAFHPPGASYAVRLSDAQGRGRRYSIFSFGGAIGFAIGPMAAVGLVAWGGMKGLVGGDGPRAPAGADLLLRTAERSPRAKRRSRPPSPVAVLRRLAGPLGRDFPHQLDHGLRAAGVPDDGADCGRRNGRIGDTRRGGALDLPWARRRRER